MKLVARAVVRVRSPAQAALHLLRHAALQREEIAAVALQERLGVMDAVAADAAVNNSMRQLKLHDRIFPVSKRRKSPSCSPERNSIPA